MEPLALSLSRHEAHRLAYVLNRGPRLYRSPADCSRLHEDRRPPSPMPPKHAEAQHLARLRVPDATPRRARRHPQAAPSVPRVLFGPPLRRGVHTRGGGKRKRMVNGDG